MLHVSVRLMALLLAVGAALSSPLPTMAEAPADAKLVDLVSSLAQTQKGRELTNDAEQISVLDDVVILDAESKLDDRRELASSPAPTPGRRLLEETASQVPSPSRAVPAAAPTR
jgi:hypothetical protein